MTTTFPDRLELIPRLAVQSRQQKYALWVGVGIVIAVLLVLFVMFLKVFPNGELDWSVLAGKLWKKIKSDPLRPTLDVLVIALTAVHLVYLLFIQRRERLVLTSTGIQRRSPMPEWVPFVRATWSLSWAQVRSATLRKGWGGNSQMVMLEMVAGGQKYRLYPFYWVDPATHVVESPWKQAFRALRPSPEAMAAQIEEGPLVQYVTKALPHTGIQRPESLFAKPFAIEKNRTALTLTAVFFVLLAYAIVDGGFLLHETYALEPPFESLIIIGLMAMGIGMLWMLRSRVPFVESLVIALFTGAAAGAAAYPGLLRINALTDTEGLRPYDYELRSCTELRPHMAGLPVLAFPKYCDYWSQFKAGSVQVFELRRGGLNFYQLNMAPIEQRMRIYYRKQKH